MTRLFLLVTLLGLVAPTSSATPPACAVDSLAWMAGSWSATRNGVREEEHWMAPRARVMVGMNRVASETKLRGFEYFRIEERADGIYYVSSPGGALPTPFQLKECGRNHVVFENLEHDFPQRILYRRDHADTLRARIEGDVMGRPRSAEWTWTRNTLVP